MTAVARTTQPPHRLVAGVQQQVHGALERASALHDPRTVLDVLGSGHEDDVAGLSRLLAALQVTTPGELVGLIKLLTASASFTSLTWARALPTAAEVCYSPSDVLRAAWVDASFH